MALEEQMINAKKTTTGKNKRQREKIEIKMFIINALCALHKPSDHFASFVYSDRPSPALKKTWPSILAMHKLCKETHQSNKQAVGE